MRLHEHFLKSDLHQASREFWCVKDVLKAIHEELSKGNAEKAKHLSIELTRSLHELSRLADKKYEMDRINRLVEQMGTAGINIEVLRMVKVYETNRLDR